MVMSPQLVFITAVYCLPVSIVIGGAAASVVDVGLPDGAFAPQATFDADFVSLLSSLFVSWRITKTTTNGMRRSTRLRIVRLRLRRFSASCMAARRASLFWRWRSRLVALGTAGESTDAEYGQRIAGRPRYHCWS